MTMQSCFPSSIAAHVRISLLRNPQGRSSPPPPNAQGNQPRIDLPPHDLQKKEWYSPLLQVDLRLLQQELRKLLNKIKGKNVQRTHKENAPSQSKTRQPTIEPSLTLKVRSPTQRSLSKPPQKPPKTSDSKKQENSPRFNEDVKHHLNFE